MRGADVVVVNSSFTKGVVEGVWNGLGGERGVAIVYPCVDTREKREKVGSEDGKEMWKGKKVVLSINRFERKKDIGLAIRAFAGLELADRKDVRLVIAGMSVGIREVDIMKLRCLLLFSRVSITVLTAFNNML